MKPLNPETIRVWMSIILITAGVVIALVVVISPLVLPDRPLDAATLKEEMILAFKMMSLAVASTGGGVVLAKSIKGESNVKNRDTDSPNK